MELKSKSEILQTWKYSGKPGGSISGIKISIPPFYCILSFSLSLSLCLSLCLDSPSGLCYVIFKSKVFWIKHAQCLAALLLLWLTGQTLLHTGLNWNIYHILAHNKDTHCIQTCNATMQCHHAHRAVRAYLFALGKKRKEDVSYKCKQWDALWMVQSQCSLIPVLSGIWSLITCRCAADVWASTESALIELAYVQNNLHRNTYCLRVKWTCGGNDFVPCLAFS